MSLSSPRALSTPPGAAPLRSHLAALQGAFPEQNPHFRSGFSLLLLLCSVLVGAKFTPGMFLFKQTLKHEAASCIFCVTVITKILSWGHTLPSQAPSPSPRQAHTHPGTDQIHPPVNKFADRFGPETSPSHCPPDRYNTRRQRVFCGARLWLSVEDTDPRTAAASSQGCCLPPKS